MHLLFIYSLVVYMHIFNLNIIFIRPKRSCWKNMYISTVYRIEISLKKYYILVIITNWLGLFSVTNLNKTKYIPPKY